LDYFKILAADGNNLVHGVYQRNGYTLMGTKEYGEKLPVSTHSFKTIFCNKNNSRSESLVYQLLVGMLPVSMEDVLP
jgi:hypothetical protein